MKKRKIGPVRMAIRVVLTVVSLYVALQVFRAYNNVYTTEVVIAATMNEGFRAQGVACFPSVNIEGSGNIGYLVQNGERVSSGAQVGEIYADPAQAYCREELNDLENKISLLERSQNVNGTDLSVLTSQMQAALYDLLDAMDTGRYQQMKEGEQSYLLAANRMQVSTGQSVDFSAAMSALQSRREEVLAQLGSPEGVYAPAGGYFISGESARYLNCDEDTLQQASPGQLQQMLQDGVETTGSYVGKVITNYHWNYYGVCTLEQADKLEQLSKVTICFPGKAEDPLPAQLVSVDRDEENGIAKFCLKCEYIGADVLCLGQQEIEIELNSHSGLRVPAAAMHIVDEAKGVYVKYGNLAKFRKIEPVYQNEEYILVPDKSKMNAEQAAATQSEVKLYDEVIVQGKGLFNNKLLS